MTAPYTRRFEEVQRAERERIAAQRRVRGVGDGESETVGVALSGGGIRSASFGLGVLQGLQRGDLLRRADYLSSVSGGGYLASSLTWFRRGGDTDFPFGVPGIGVRSNSAGTPTRVLGYLQQHGRYLTPAGGDDGRVDGDSERATHAGARRGVPMISFVGWVLRATFLSVFVYGSILVGVFALLGVLDRVADLLKPILAGLSMSASWDGAVAELNFALMFGAVALGLLAASWVTFPYFNYAKRRRAARHPDDPRAQNRFYAATLRAERFTGRVLAVVVAAGLLGSVPIAAAWASGRLEDVWARSAAAASSVLFGALMGASNFRGRARESVGEPGTLAAYFERLRLYGAAFLVLYGLLMLSKAIADGLMNGSFVGGAFAILAVGVVTGLLANLNFAGIGQMYRNRLMETFLPGDSSVEQNQWRPAFDANAAQLDDMCGGDTAGPYHLINSNVILVGSRHSRFRGRGGDSFLLSPLYCGSDATGWRGTDEWMQGRMTLATAMAISGAAANPGAAVDGSGVTRSGLVSALMSVLGLRLGYWARNPNPVRGTSERPPNYLQPGLLRGVLGRRLNEEESFIELSDGGHFENLGVYELMRRRVDVIVVSDASCDPDYAFDSLGNAIERVRVDFGIDVGFDDPDFDLEGLRPGSGEDGDGGDQLPTARRGFAVGTIRYPDPTGALEKLGVLIYVKPALIGAIPPDVLRFRSVHPDFPHQTTADQFFDEHEVEAYRELGYRIVRELVEENAQRRKAGTPVDHASGARHGPWL